MPLHRESQTVFTQSGSKPSYIAIPDGAEAVVYSTGATLYYDNAASVTSSSNDGSISTGASASFTSSQYVITATGASTQVFVYVPEALTLSKGEVQAENFLSGSGGPTSGTSGTGVGKAQAGALYVNEANGVIYVNEGTTASPYWTPQSFDQAGLLGVYEDWRNLPGAILGGNVPAITDTGTVGWTPEGARVCGLGLAETDSGLAQGTNVEGSQVARLTCTAAADARAAALAGPVVAQFQPDTNGPIVVDCEFTHVSAITARDSFIGFVGAFADNAAPPLTGATTTATFGIDDLAGIFQSTIFTDGDGLMLVSEKGDAAGTQVSLTAAADLAAAATYQRLRVEVSSDGQVRAFKNKAQIGSTFPGATGANAHTAGTAALDVDEEIIPIFLVGTTTTTAVSVDIKRFGYWGTRP